MEFVIYFMFPCVGNMFGESGKEEIKEAMKNNGKLDILASLRLVMYSYLMYSCIKIFTISYKFIYNQCMVILMFLSHHLLTVMTKDQMRKR